MCSSIFLEPFHVTEAESRDVPIMKEDREYLYAEAEGVKLLKLSYGGSASMLLAMPEQGAMDGLLKDLAHRDGLDLIRRWQTSISWNLIHWRIVAFHDHIDHADRYCFSPSAKA